MGRVEFGPTPFDTFRKPTPKEIVTIVAVAAAGFWLLPKGSNEPPPFPAPAETPSVNPAPTPEALVDAPAGSTLDKVSKAQHQYLRDGKFLVWLINDAPPQYVLCDETFVYTVQPGDALSGIAVEHHVHYQYGGQRQSVAMFPMLTAIEYNNPNTSYSFENSNSLQIGDKLVLPVDGSCNTTFDTHQAVIDAAKPRN